jgi:predicted nucleic acid-binding protein
VSRFILDASVALAWFIDPVVHPYAETVRERLRNKERAVVPALWRIEVANGFVIADRRRTLAPADISLALERLDALWQKSIDVNEQTFSARRLLATARNFKLTAYDAEYLESALALQLPLATLDRKLIEAARQADVEILRH